MFYKFNKTTSLYQLTIVIIICSCVQNSANQQLERCDTENVFMSDSQNCSRYFMCKDGLKYQLDCGNDLKFNPSTGKCDSISESDCQNGKTKYFPYRHDAESDKTPKLSCYISNWDSCEVNQMICDDSCYLYNNINVDSRFSENSDEGECQLSEPKRDYKVICYYASFIFTYSGKAKFFPDDIDPSLCSHIVYFRAAIDNATLNLKAFDPWVDFDNSGYSKILAMKAKGPKVVLAVGGWSESNDDKFSRVIASDGSRKKFIIDAIAYLEKWGFEGIEIDWQYPKCWQNSCRKGPASDSTNFLKFIKQLSAAFKKKNFSVSVAGARSLYVIDESYDIGAVSKYVDWISVQSQNYYFASQGRTGHVASLYSNGGSDLNVNHTLQYIISKGADPRKIIMAIPPFTNNMLLSDPAETGIGSIVEGTGPSGDYLKESDILGFNEICYYVKNQEGWTVVTDPTGKVGPYAYKGNQWVSYDDIASVKRKCDYIKKYKLGGAYFWTPAYDDVRDRCGCGKFPILTTIAQELLGIPKRNNLVNCI